MDRGILYDDMKFEQASPLDIQVSAILGTAMNKSKGPEVETYLECGRSLRKAVWLTNSNQGERDRKRVR